MRERLYIVRLWRTSRILFLAVALFVAGQCYFLKKEVFNFPFFVFGMYSSPVPAPDTISLPVLRINGRAYNYTCLPNWKEGFVLNGMNFYVRQLEGNIWTAMPGSKGSENRKPKRHFSTITGWSLKPRLWPGFPNGWQIICQIN